MTSFPAKQQKNGLENILISVAYRVLPSPILKYFPPIYYAVNRYRYRVFVRPHIEKETSKARARRLREGFFEKYCQGEGLDIGYGGDLVVPGCQGWDIEDGDAQLLSGLQKESFDFIYSSHLLEHLLDPAAALARWWEVLRPGGYLILYVPHRDLYEKKLTLPSRFSLDHKHYFLLDCDEAPDTLGILPLLARLPDMQVIEAKICSEGWTITNPLVHSNGEYSIEVVVQKKAS